MSDLDFYEILRDVYDPTNNALRVRFLGGDVNKGGLEDWEQSFELCYDPTNHCLNVKDIGSSGTPGTMLDWTQVIKKVVDNTTSRLRTVT